MHLKAKGKLNPMKYKVCGYDVTVIRSFSLVRC